jgi:membrane protein
VARPEGPGDLSRRTWWRTLKRTAREFRSDELTDRAAGLTYYSVLSLFPALIALVSIVGVFGDPAAVTRALTGILREVSPSTAASAVTGPVAALTANRSAAGILLVVGLAVALWTASNYVGAFMRTANAVYESEESRPFWKLRPLQMAITLGIVVMLALVLFGLVVSGPVAEGLGDALGLGGTAVVAWNLAKWPVLAALVLTVFAVLYYAAPAARPPAFRWITPGSVVALVAWVAASAAFGLYVANFGSYDRTYGTLGGVVTFLVWLWISNLALVFGLELNAQLERSREAHAADAAAPEGAPAA